MTSTRSIRPVAALAIVPLLLHATTCLAASPSPRLYAAIKMVETGGDANAVGDHGLAQGGYGIHRLYWDDACRFGGVDWSYDRLVTSDWHCRKVMAWYWQWSHARTDEQRARVHNGGPRGATKKATIVYWKKVRAFLRSKGA